jgi:hypothetical protein
MRVAAHPDEVRAALPGDEVVPDATVVMDRGFDLPASPEAVWPWFAQLGRDRAGWYLPRWVERLLPANRRARVIAVAPTATGSRVHLRLRLAGMRRRRLVQYGGGLFDLLTVAGLAAGLRERVR